MATKTWLITGASRGFGRVWAEAALARGDRVAVTARDKRSVADFADRYPETALTMTLDVTDRAAVFATVEAAHDHFGRLDVIIDNAGYGLFGTIEEVSEADIRQQMETNFFGAVWIIQAALPLLRAQGGGHIIPVTSIGGIGAFPLVGIYNASKWALEAIGEALEGEVAAFGIKVTMIEPGPFATDWGGSSAKHAATNPAYDDLRKARAQVSGQAAAGDPEATATAILEIVDSPAPPLRLFLGPLPMQIARHKYAERMKTWEEWADVADAAHGDRPR